MSETIDVACPECLVCRKKSTMTVSKVGHQRWHGGAYIQDAFPELTPDQRELLLTGTHPECWKELFPDE